MINDIKLSHVPGFIKNNKNIIFIFDFIEKYFPNNIYFLILYYSKKLLHFFCKKNEFLLQ